MYDTLRKQLLALYNEELAEPAFRSLVNMLTEYQARLSSRKEAARYSFSQKDSILITYGDMVREAGMTPLQSLADFLDARLAGVFSTVHVLPFYPYSSDDGFSVIDYKSVDPDLGTWEDVAGLGRNFRLMFDAVINHVSSKSAWFQGFLRDKPHFRDYFIAVPEGTDLSKVFRPRALPLLSPFETAGGRKLVWTTFSEDQIDLNYANPSVVLDMIDTILFYVSKGAELIRLDAVAFLWKALGTSCIHLPQTHAVIQLFRTVLDFVAPYVSLVTETNVPHKDNVAYFGDGSNEAQMVYNFSLPPLTLQAFHSGDASVLTRWAQTLTLPSKQVTFFNFLASHDGIGLMPARGFLSEAQINLMAQRVEALGGHVSYRSNADGSQSAYELNINYLDALGDPVQPEENVDVVARRFLASQAIMLALRGVPGVYFHSVFGSRGWKEGVDMDGRPRTINREKLQRRRLEQELEDSHSLRHRVFSGYRHLLSVRKNHLAFHPGGEQQVQFFHQAIFALVRSSPDGRQRILCLHNTCGKTIAAEVDLTKVGLGKTGHLSDLLTGHRFPIPNRKLLQIAVQPYQVLWLTNSLWL